MRALLFAILLLPFASTSFAGTMWFEPPNPTDETRITAHHMTLWHNCVPRDVSTERNGTTGTIIIRFDCAAAQPFNSEADIPVALGMIAAGVYEVRAVATTGDLILSRDNFLVVREALPAFRLEPDVIPPLTGGQRVTIRGAGIAPVCAVAPCPAPLVTFGDKQAEVVETKGTDTIVVIAPEDFVHTVDVSVKSAATTHTAIAAFHYGDLDPAFFETIFFPTIVNGPGAFGARWMTEVVMRNENDDPVTSGTWLFGLQSVPPHSTITSTSLNWVDGFRFLVPRQAAPKLSFNVRVKDLSRQSQSSGTEIPVLREKDNFRQSFSILNVPLDPGFRVTLRVYRLDRRLGVRATVRSLASDEILVDVRPDGGDHIVLDLSGDPRLAGKGPLRIDADGTWGFVSVTNNETQQVTIIPAQ